MTSYSTSAPVGTSDWILGAIKRNPEGFSSSRGRVCIDDA